MLLIKVGECRSMQGFQPIFTASPSIVATLGKLREVKGNALLDKIAGQSAKALGTVVDSRGMEIPPYDVSGLACEPRAGLTPNGWCFAILIKDNQNGGGSVGIRKGR